MNKDFMLKGALGFNREAPWMHGSSFENIDVDVAVSLICKKVQTVFKLFERNLSDFGTSSMESGKWKKIGFQLPKTDGYYILSFNFMVLMMTQKLAYLLIYLAIGTLPTLILSFQLIILLTISGPSPLKALT